MASANPDLIRSICAAWERGDYSSAEWAHPEIELAIADGPTSGRWTGLAGMAEGWRGFLDAWDEWRIDADEYRELDDGRVLYQRERVGLAHRRAQARAQTAGSQAEVGCCCCCCCCCCLAGSPPSSDGALTGPVVSSKLLED